MKSIVIISSSIRKDRKSHRIALYFKNYLEENKIANAIILDLKDYNFPIFEERLKFISEPSDQMLSFAKKIEMADGIIIVTPEYNGGYPASLKNIIDFLHPEWKRKPIAISTVSSGSFAGTQVITSLQFSLWKIGALMVPAMFPVPNIENTFDENGEPSDKEFTDNNANNFINELIWWIDAKKKMEQQ